MMDEMVIDGCCSSQRGAIELVISNILMRASVKGNSMKQMLKDRVWLLSFCLKFEVKLFLFDDQLMDCYDIILIRGRLDEVVIVCIRSGSGMRLALFMPLVRKLRHLKEFLFINFTQHQKHTKKNPYSYLVFRIS
jgi:hypothetical protein